MVSIVVPVYNVQDYILECLCSVAEQKTSIPIECIIVDDCGQDESMKFVESFISRYCGPISFKIVHHDHNKGLSAARNTGIHESNGEWLYFLDSDDWISDDCIYRLFNTLKDYPESEIVFSGATAVSLDGRESYIWSDWYNDDVMLFSNNQQWIREKMMKRFDLGMTSWNRLVKKSFIEGNNIFFQEGLIHEDEPWNMKLAQNASNISICPFPTYYYRIRNNSIMASVKDNDTRVLKLIPMLYVMSDLIDNVYPSMQARMLWNIVSETYSLPGVSVENHIKEQELLHKIRIHLNLIERLALYIYSDHQNLYRKIINNRLLRHAFHMLMRTERNCFQQVI